MSITWEDLKEKAKDLGYKSYRFKGSNGFCQECLINCHTFWENGLVWITDKKDVITIDCRSAEQMLSLMVGLKC